MDINDIFTKGFDFNDAWSVLWPVAIYVLGMSAYAVFVFKFYRFVAARDTFDFDLSRYEEVSYRFVRSTIHVVLYVFKYLILFPIFAFFWFAILTVVLAFLSKDQSFSQTLLIALATVSAIRVTAYLHEDLSRDVAKLLPFAVLGVFLIDAGLVLNQRVAGLPQDRRRLQREHRLLPGVPDRAGVRAAGADGHR